MVEFEPDMAYRIDAFDNDKYMEGSACARELSTCWLLAAVCENGGRCDGAEDLHHAVSDKRTAQARAGLTHSN